MNGGIRSVYLLGEDTIELSELLEFLADWIEYNEHLAGPGVLIPFESRNPAYNAADLRADLARYALRLAEANPSAFPNPIRPGCLPAEDTIELSELLEFMADWIERDEDRADRALIPFVAWNPAYNAADLHADLTRYASRLAEASPGGVGSDCSAKDDS